MTLGRRFHALQFPGFWVCESFNFAADIAAEKDLQLTCSASASTNALPIPVPPPSSHGRRRRGRAMVSTKRPRHHGAFHDNARADTGKTS